MKIEEIGNEFITSMLKKDEYQNNDFEADLCSLEEMLDKDKFDEKFKGKEKCFGVYFILNNEENLTEDNLDTIYNIYGKNESLNENQYKIKGILTKKLETLNVLSEEESPILQDMQKILYIGKAGGKEKSDLYNRLKLYMEYGKGKPRSHKGGRAIWQIKNEKRKELKVCWIYLPEDEPCENAEKLEKYLLKEYNKKVCECLEKNEKYKKYLSKSKKYKYPFANWRN